MPCSKRAPRSSSPGCGKSWKTRRRGGLPRDGRDETDDDDGQTVTQRPKEHQVGLKALKAVSHLFRNAEQDPREVANDYGEDLVVQTSHEGRMDASRLWVQVKGTARIKQHKKGGGLSLPVSFDHAMRWIHAVDLVVVVLWDVVERIGWWAIPRDQVDVFGALKAGKKTITLRFSEEDVLTEEAVGSLVWRSRLEHHRLLVLAAHDTELELERTEGIKSADRVLTALDFTDLIGITERRSGPDGLAYRVRAEVWDEFGGLFRSLEEKELTEKDRVLGAALVTLFRRASMIDDAIDLPGVLAEEGADFLLKAAEGKGGIRPMIERAEAREAREVQEAGWPGEGLR
ncbi:MAG TPA: DUF4365 domain-containing protein [Solirubrobacterales bacterium]|nr:DUF4365 domain-containing protein [Solirubrobacterales bacterium]